MLQVLGKRKAVIHTGYIFNIPRVNGLRFMNMHRFYTERNFIYMEELSQKYVSICPEQFAVICGVSKDQVPKFTIAVKNSRKSVYQSASF